jgi:DNA-binding NarL/FixJ family response regulator
MSQGSGSKRGEHRAADHEKEASRGVGAVRVLTVDDMTLFRQGIQSLLKGRDSVEVVGEASDAQEAADLVQELDPDVVLLDQTLPDLDTPATIVLLKQRRARVEVIVLSEASDEEGAFRALEAGASAFVLKDISTENLVRAIHGVCNGRTVMHPDITRQLIDRFRLLARERMAGGDGHLTGLTGRELEIVIEMAKGSTDREIARKASLAESTVKSHIRSILRKIGARNRTQAVAYVLRKGLMR